MDPIRKCIKVILIAGARPNFMKIAPLIRAIKNHNKKQKKEHVTINYKLVHTGQHYDIKMSEVFFKELDLPSPDINLEVGSDSHAVQTAAVMTSFESVCLEDRPDWVIVVGDVNSTMACTLVASKLGIKVAHVEAGLRSFDRTMPEEINRLVTDALADLLLTPSEDADENLIREGVSQDKIKCVGNIMIDTLVFNLEKARQCKTNKKFGLKGNNYVFVTLHRPSNVDDIEKLKNIFDCLFELSEEVPIIFPMHPRTKKQLKVDRLWNKANSMSGLHLVDPMGYHDSICLIDKASFVLTDSGGLQEETTFLNVPCLTLRPNTERPITITQGTNKLTSLETLEHDLAHLLNGNKPHGKNPALWDGKSAERIIEVLQNYK